MEKAFVKLRGLFFSPLRFAAKMMVGIVAWKLARGSAAFWARGNLCGGGGVCLFLVCFLVCRSGEAALLRLGCTLDGALVHLVLVGEDLETGQGVSSLDRLCRSWRGASPCSSCWALAEVFEGARPM